MNGLITWHGMSAPAWGFFGILVTQMTILIKGRSKRIRRETGRAIAASPIGNGFAAETKKALTENAGTLQHHAELLEQSAATLARIEGQVDMLARAVLPRLHR